MPSPLSGPPKFAGGDVYTIANAGKQRLTPQDFRLRPDSPGYKAGKDGKDLGADVDLVGPGEAYERWKKTPDYKQWLKETQQVTRADLSERELEAAAREFDQALTRVGLQNPYGPERQQIVNQFLTSDDLFHRVAALRPQDTSLWGVRAHLFAEEGNWKAAIASFKKRLELGGDGAGFCYGYAAALLAANDVDGYREVCKEMLGKFGNVSDPLEAWFVVWTTAIAPDSIDDKQQALRIAERVMNGHPNERYRVWPHAAWLYRLGRLEESIVSWERVGKDNWAEVGLCFLAMAHHRLGNEDQARQYADQVSSKIVEWSKLPPWTRGVYSKQLFNEMKAVLAAPPDARAADPSESDSTGEGATKNATVD
jgi:tetratricopeptide (TPR) repeat protein